MLHSNNITWNALSLNDPLEKERRLCCNTTNATNTTSNTNDEDENSQNSDLEQRIRHYAEIESENIHSVRQTVTAELANAFGRVDSEGREIVETTPYQASSDALATISDTLEMTSETIYLHETDPKLIEKPDLYQFISGDNLKELQKVLEDYQHIISLQNQWLSGKLSPNEYRTEIQNTKNALHDQNNPHWEEFMHFADQSLGNIGRAIQEVRGENVPWHDLTPKEKLQVLNISNDEIPGLTGFISALDSEAADIKKSMKTVLEHIYKHGHNTDTFGNDTNNILNDSLAIFKRIKWISVNEMIKGTKLWWESIKRSHRQYSDERAAGFASALGKLSRVLPGKAFKDVDDILAEDLKKQDGEVRNNYLNYYKSNGPTYLDVFNNGGIWDKAYDTQRKLAILLYAAENGWLYGIESGDIYTPLGGKIRMIDLVGGDEKGANDFFTEIQSMNASGVKKNAESAYDRVKGLDNQNKLQKELRKALKEVNLPAVLGIARRCNEKGLDGRANERSLVAILDAIHDPDVGHLIRNAITEEWLDNVGKINAADATIGIGHLKPDRAPMYKYVKNYERMGGREGMYNAGVSGRAYTLARKKIIDLDPDLAKSEREDDLQGYIADLLSSRDVKLGNPEKILSIWSQDFRFYRKSRGMTEFDAANHKPDTDWDYSDQVSSQILRSQKVWDRILTTGSEGSFDKDYGDQAKAFIRKLFNTTKEKRKQVNDKKISKDEFLEYMRHVQGNIGGWVQSKMQSYTAEKFATIKDPTNSKKLLLTTFLETKLLSPKVIIDAITDFNDTVPLRYLEKSGQSLPEFARLYEVTTYLEGKLEQLHKTNPAKEAKLRGLMNANNTQAATNTENTNENEGNEDD